MISRRHLLGFIPTLAALGGCTGVIRQQRQLRVTLTGQSLMKQSLCAETYTGFADIVRELQRGDVLFTNLEVAIKTERSGAPTRDNDFFHASSTDVLECLKAMGFDLLSLSNNHAWDLGTDGILATREAVRDYGFTAAGTGANIDEATQAAYLDAPEARIALVAMATEKLRDGAAATTTRAGLNELRLRDGAPDKADAARVLEQIRVARRDADIVIVYHHNHDWGDDMAITRPWAETFAARCVDAGADLYVSHGAPLLHGIGRHGDGAIFFGLGSLVFHSITPVGYYRPEVWETAIVHCNYRDFRLHDLEIIPVVLNELGDDPARHNKTRGRPRIAAGADARRILTRLQSKSAVYGLALNIDGGRGKIVFG